MINRLLARTFIPSAVIALTIFFRCFTAVGQNPEIAFISDTQAPMWVEKLFHRNYHNEEATGKLFDQILKLKPQTLFITGDVTALSSRNKKWRAMDSYLDRCRQAGINVYALPGNHDVMGSADAGERNFLKRFPETRFTGFYKVVDSIAFVLLNSNFKKLKSSDIGIQQQWYQETLTLLDSDPSVKCIIVCCHHAPYSNSKAVGSSSEVQIRFVPLFLQSRKCRLFITGHSHAFEHFNFKTKDFLVIGGGGGIHQRLGKRLPDLEPAYKPIFHFLTITKSRQQIDVRSYPLADDLSQRPAYPVIELSTY